MKFSKQELDNLKKLTDSLKDKDETIVSIGEGKVQWVEWEKQAADGSTGELAFFLRGDRIRKKSELDKLISALEKYRNKLL